MSYIFTVSIHSGSTWEKRKVNFQRAKEYLTWWPQKKILNLTHIWRKREQKKVKPGGHKKDYKCESHLNEKRAKETWWPQTNYVTHIWRKKEQKKVEPGGHKKMMWLTFEEKERKRKLNLVATATSSATDNLARNPKHLLKNKAKQWKMLCNSEKRRLCWIINYILWILEMEKGMIKLVK